MKFVLEDLGVQAHGDRHMNCRRAIHPRTQEELALVALARGGFLIINPRERSGYQIKPEPPVNIGSESWAVGQAPDGSIYAAEGFNRYAPARLLRWDWTGGTSRVAATLPQPDLFTLDIALDGRVYLPEYTSNRMYRYDPQSGRVEDLGDFKEFGDHIRDVSCAPDGLVYVTSTNYRRTVIVGMNPQTGKRFISDEYKIPSQTTPIIFRDGSRITQLRGTKVTLVDAAGASSEFEVKIEESPLRIFCIASGGGKIWGGTFIPLTLFAYDPATAKTTPLGNPTETDGEIYGMVYSENKLFIASYYAAVLSRYTPTNAWQPGNDLSANPRHLGKMKEDGLSLQRPHGHAMDREGNVYFAALGGYGCEDSGLSRIHPHSEEVTRWIYLNTTFGALCYLPATNQLLVAESRKDEGGIRFTFLSPSSGEVISSAVVIRDRGEITSWLHDGADIVYGVHAYRATIFAYSLSQSKIIASMEEMRFGDHCHNALLFGPDGRIWGLTNDCVFAATRDLKHADRVADYEDHACRNFNRFGMCYGSDGAVYFPNGDHLMRIRES